MFIHLKLFVTTATLNYFAKGLSNYRDFVPETFQSAITTWSPTAQYVDADVYLETPRLMRWLRVHLTLQPEVRGF